MSKLEKWYRLEEEAREIRRKRISENCDVRTRFPLHSYSFMV